MKVSLTACICTYNRYEYLSDCLNSLFNQVDVKPEDFSILIVDNTPPPLRKTILLDGYQQSPFYSRVEIVYSDIPGLSRARNIGIETTSSDVVAFIDDDAIANPAWAANIIQCFQIDSAIGCVGGKVEPIWESDGKPDWISTSLLGYFSVVNWPSDGPRELKPGEWLAGANVAYKISHLGGKLRFDEDLGRNGSTSSLLSNEEIRLNELLAAKGSKSFYTPHARVDHLVPATRTTKSWLARRIAWQAVSDYLKNGKAGLSINANSNWDHARKLIYEMRPEYRNINAIALPSSNPDEISLQAEALYSVIYAALDGFGGD